MPATPIQPLALQTASPARWEAASWAAGLGFSFILFSTLARLGGVAGGSREPEIADLAVVSFPVVEPPPPKPAQPPAPEEPAPPLVGIEAGPSDSAVKISVLPPDLAALLPPQPPRATVALGRIAADLKPRAEVEMDARHVYQQSEVDERPRAVVRAAPPVGNFLRQAPSLSVDLLLLIGVDGHAESIRVIRSSGQPEFDALVGLTVRDGWVFSPAIKRGRKVRCLAEQSVTVTMGGSQSPFDVR
jgi:outer membrane biosynthesis protein TonB